MKILKIALAVPLRKSFDYLALEASPSKALKPGVRVRVPFQKRQLVGVYLGGSEESKISLSKLKAIEEVLDEEPVLTPEIMKLTLWAADYYHCPIGEVFQAALPGYLRQGKKLPLPPYIKNKPPKTSSAALTLNEKQATIVDAVSAALDHYSVFTIDGVTGSGKTEVYLQVIAKVIAEKKQALVLVPEINLTPQTIEHFRQRFAVPIVALHSGLTEKTRCMAWLAAASGEALIIIGTRSAIFTPLANPGLIIVDEEHDPSFKQQDSFRYNARDLAIWRARDAKVPILLGSATPSLETLHRSLAGHYQYFMLPERAGGAQMPSFNVVDLRRQALDEGLSPTLLQQIKQHLANDNQVLLFLNRRGYSPLIMCHNCGWMAVCKHCDARMTYHLKPLRLQCHYCEAQRSIPKSCDSCHENTLYPLGLGTEKLELALQRNFPEAPLLRIDRDSTRGKGKMEAMLEEIHQGNYKILLGTQMLAKGHHFPNVTLVGIIDADYGLFSSDFRASERLGQLLLQVAGRAGRALKPGQVWIQTHHPEHPLIQLLKQGCYQPYAKSLLEEREAAALPPYSSLALLHAEAHKLQEVEIFLNQVKTLAKSLGTEVLIRGPISAIMARRAGRHRMQLLFQADQKKTLQHFLHRLLLKVEDFSSKMRIHWAVDVDPIEMM